MAHLVNLPPQICTDSYSNVNLCHVFYLKTYLLCTEHFRKKPDGLSCHISVFG